MRILKALIGDDSGATVIEYALIAMFISIAAFIAIQQIGHTINNTFNNVASNMSR